MHLPVSWAREKRQKELPKNERPLRLMLMTWGTAKRMMQMDRNNLNISINTEITNRYTFTVHPSNSPFYIVRLDRWNSRYKSFPCLSILAIENLQFDASFPMFNFKGFFFFFGETWNQDHNLSLLLDFINFYVYLFVYFYLIGWMSRII